MVTLALRCLFVIGLGAVVATDWAKLTASLLGVVWARAIVLPRIKDIVKGIAKHTTIFFTVVITSFHAITSVVYCENVFLKRKDER